MAKHDFVIKARRPGRLVLLCVALLALIAAGLYAAYLRGHHVAIGRRARSLPEPGGRPYLVRIARIARNNLRHRLNLIPRVTGPGAGTRVVDGPSRNLKDGQRVKEKSNR